MKLTGKQLKKCLVSPQKSNLFDVTFGDGWNLPSSLGLSVQSVHMTLDKKQKWTCESGESVSRKTIKITFIGSEGLSNLEEVESLFKEKRFTMQIQFYNPKGDRTNIMGFQNVRLVEIYGLVLDFDSDDNVTFTGVFETLEKEND